MPLYEFECLKHGLSEILLPRAPEKELRKCPEKGCRRKAKLVVSAVTMRPDNMWAGVRTDDGKYWTSRSKFDKDQRRRNIERITSQRDLDAMKKMADEGKKAKKEKAARSRRKIVEKVMAEVPDNLLKESAFDANGRFKR